MRLTRWMTGLVLVFGVVMLGRGLQAQDDVGVSIPDKVIVEVYSLPDPRKTDIFTKASRAVLDEFRRRYPHIEMVGFSGIQIEGMEMDSGPLMAIAGGVSPDVIYVNFRQSDTYIRNNFLYPLDDFIKELPGGQRLLADPQQYFEDYYHDKRLRDVGRLDDRNRRLHLPKQDVEGDINRNQGQYTPGLRMAKAAWPVICRPKGEAKESHVWAMPFGTLVRVLVYRKDLFHKVGLDPERPPQNWDELYQYARQLTNPEEGTYGMYLASGQSASWDWIAYLWSAGGRAVEINDEGRWEAVFDSDAGVVALEYYLKLVTTKHRGPDGKEYTGFVTRESNSTRRNQMWADGKIGMQLTYLHEDKLGSSLDANLYGMAPVPMGPARRAAEINCTMKGIFSEAGESNNAGLGDRNPDAVKRAAWEYIWFVDSEVARQIKTKVLVESGYGKFLNPLYLERYGYDELLKFSNPEWRKTYEDALESGQPEPYGKNCQLVYQYMTNPIDEAIRMEKNGELGDTQEERRANLKDILSKWATYTNDKMIGYVPPETMKFRRRVATTVAIVIAVIFALVLYWVWKIFTPEDNPNVRGWMIKKYAYAYLLLVPALGLILLWKYVPMVLGSIMAFQDYAIVGDSTFIGIDNFATVLFDGDWWWAILMTLYYMFLMLTLGFLPPVFLAILLQEVSHGKTVYRVIYYLPAVITGVIVIFLWKLMFDPGPEGGLNQIFSLVGMGPYEWLDNPNWAMICCVLPMVWAQLGPGCLIYLAALKGIPDDLYEAADLDGANFLHKVAYIVFPRLKALILIQMIALFIMASQQSGFILVMTYGGPQNATNVAGLEIFKKAYVNLQFGIATTMAWILGIMLMGFTVIQLRRLSNMEFKAAGAQVGDKKAS